MGISELQFAKTWLPAKLWGHWVIANDLAQAYPYACGFDRVRIDGVLIRPPERALFEIDHQVKKIVILMTMQEIDSPTLKIDGKQICRFCSVPVPDQHPVDFAHQLDFDLNVWPSVLWKHLTQCCNL